MGYTPNLISFGCEYKTGSDNNNNNNNIGRVGETTW